MQLAKIKRLPLLWMVVLLVVLSAGYPTGLAIARAAVPATSLQEVEQRGLSPATGTISSNSGLVEISRDGNWCVEIDTQTLDIVITDTVTGRAFHALSGDESLPAAARSPLIIGFLGEDRTTYEWNAYTNSIAAGGFALERIAGGVRIRLDFRETETYRLYEYIPRYIAIERYDEIFEGRLTQNEADGSISAEQASMYRKALRAFYSKDAQKGYYYSKSSGLPTASVLRLLVEFTQAIAYTREELIADNEQYNIVTDFKEPASFTVYMEVTFENGALTVNVPTYAVESGNDFYTLQSVSVYPAFDCRKAEQNDGYVFVPDGAGMLIPFDSFDGTYPVYSRAIYRSDLYTTKFKKSSYNESLHMPVFGLYGTDAQGRSSGFMAVIESGAELAKATVSLKSGAGDGSGGLYNAVYASADATQYSMVRIFGPYDKDETSYLRTTGLLKYDFTIRYRLYTDGADYAAFARDYRQELIQQYGLQPSYDERAKVFLQMAGAVTVWDTLLGVPYDHTISMTTYAQAEEILDDLADIPLVVNYQYALNGGRMSTVGDKARPVAANGGEQELQALLAHASKGNEIFLQTDLMRAYRKQTLYNDKRFFSRGFDGEGDWRSGFSDMWAPDGTFYTPYKYGIYYLIHPRYLANVADRFLQETDAYSHLMLTDFGSQTYGTFAAGDIVDPLTANQRAVLPVLETLASKKTLALDNPNADKIVYAAYALNISREAGDYGTSYTAVPFRQLVMNGLTEYTTLDVNGGWASEESFLLQALELGSLPKFTVFAEKPDVLMEARISSYYAAYYASVKPTLEHMYAQYQAAFAQIGTKEIVGHTTFAPGVYATTYANGVQVLVNYNAYPVEVDGYTLTAYGYEIVPSPIT